MRYTMKDHMQGHCKYLILRVRAFLAHKTNKKVAGLHEINAVEQQGGGSNKWRCSYCWKVGTLKRCVEHVRNKHLHGIVGSDNIILLDRRHGEQLRTRTWHKGPYCPAVPYNEHPKFNLKVI